MDNQGNHPWFLSCPHSIIFSSLLSPCCVYQYTKSNILISIINCPQFDFRGLILEHVYKSIINWGVSLQQLIKKLKINIKIASLSMSHPPSKSKVIYILKNQNKQTINLVLANNLQSKQGKVIDEVSNNATSKIFEIQQKININTNHVVIKHQIKCAEDNNKVYIPHHDYRTIIQLIEEVKKSEDHLDYESDKEQGSQSRGEDDNSSRENKRTIRQYNEESSINGDTEHRGRGRPKGSKNKKTIMKEAQQLKQPPTIELKTAMNGLMKRGKGRPKGSKNKTKDYNHNVKIEQGVEPLPFGKRGKGRPKGSKNKIKLPNQSMVDEQIDNQEHKRRGRPPGAKNRANSVQSASGEHQFSEQFVKFQVERPDADEMDQIYCCSRCQQTRLKRKIFQSQINIQENIDILRNVYEDLGLQNKSNLIITAIKIGDWESLQKLLSIVNKVEYFYKSPWKVDKYIERLRFETKTKKQFLSKTGKEGNTVLLHDSFKKKEIWWREITVERIIENLPRDQEEAYHILQKLFQFDSELKNEIYNNLASIIRCGNYAIAEMMLRDVLFTPNHNKLNFSHEHYDLLIGSMTLINQLKKFNLIQHNDGNNYCSPIHAASICQNSQFLRKLLQIFTDIMNVEDSLHRKPIHYAALSSNTENLCILVQSGADLKEYDRKKMTPLMLACYQGIYFNVQFILEKVRDPNYINFKSEEGYTALHYAILRNNIECIQLLINDPYVDLWALTKDKGDIFHLLAGTGNTQIMDLILKKQILPYTSHDKFKKTPPMIAIRNCNNECLVRLIENGCKMEKVDSSLNTLLHYAAAYGNIEAIHILRDRIQQTKNKRGLYPWEIAIYKGHIGAARLLQSQDEIQFSEDPLYFTLSAIRGTEEYLECIKYITDKMMNDIYFEEKNTGNGYLHNICQISEEEYIKIRKQETYLTVEEIKQEFNWIQYELITYFVDKGLDGYKENFNGQTPLKLCIENNNLIGIQKLLTGKINFDLQPSSGTSLLHCLSKLACKGLEQMKFVEKKLKQCNVGQLKVNLKKIDHNGFDFMIYFLKCFTQNALFTYKKNVKRMIGVLQHKKDAKFKAGSLQLQAEKKCYEQFLKFEDKFMSVIEFMLQLGCDINAQVVDRKNEVSQQYKKWGIQHFLMKFPSLKLVKFFKSKIRDFNYPNNQLMTPLHLFCKNIKKGNLLQASYQVSQDYQSQKILQYLLSIGFNPNCFDSNKALPILYASLNSQYQFIVTLRKYKSQINFCTTKNEIPFIEIIKRSKNFTIEQIQNLLALGIDPNFLDMDKKNSLHHLAFHSTNIDSNPDVCRLLIEYGTKINALDKYERSPIFYCFCDMEGVVHSSEPLQKVEILQVLINHKEINLNLVDVFKRTLLHYACEKNHFFSILYLLDKNINIEAKDYQENTPLAVSLKTRNLDQAALIISKGVKYGFVDQQGQKYTYFSYAFKKLSAGICFLLLDNGYPIQKALQQIPNSCFKQSLIQKYIRK